MNPKYKATTEDFEAINQALTIVFSKKLSFIFKNKLILDEVNIISFDSEYIYLWTKLKLNKLELLNRVLQNYNIYKIRHKLNLDKNQRLGWRAGIWPQSINDYLPIALRKNDFETPKICGSLLGDFIDNQKTINGSKNNPYITKESYLATIIHEFGHIYYQSHKNWWFSDKKTNLELIKKALLLYKDKKASANIQIPQPYLLSEIYAFCCEYYASKLYFLNHKKNFDSYILNILSKSMKEEQQKNLEVEDSIISEKTPHLAAFIIGKILLENFTKTWPEKLLKKSLL